MSYRHRTRLDALALPIPCPTCPARAGEWCVAGHHGYARELHKARRDPARAAYLAGVETVREAVRRSGLVVDV